ncbi:MAG: hypothetical protein CM15mP74_32630 [Halieaceae bacterium]|nr:MAG: hypothetical protein CM15mP74_32630 [Halieaceae bacterium]
MPANMNMVLTVRFIGTGSGCRGRSSVGASDQYMASYTPQKQSSGQTSPGGDELFELSSHQLCRRSLRPLMSRLKKGELRAGEGVGSVLPFWRGFYREAGYGENKRLF